MALTRTALTRTPDPIRPTRRSSDPNRPTGVTAGGGFSLCGSNLRRGIMCRGFILIIIISGYSPITVRIFYRESIGGAKNKWGGVCQVVGCGAGGAV